MKLLTQWGFSRQSWKGQRGEYWVLGQGLLLLALVLVPVYSPPVGPLPPVLSLGIQGLAVLLALGSAILLGKGFWDLGQSLTPLPYPREDAQLVQTGIYGLVRHSLYGGLVLGGLALSLGLFSLSHLGVTMALFILLNAKASQEEQWLLDRYPDYADYRQRVKKLIPWIY